MIVVVLQGQRRSWGKRLRGTDARKIIRELMRMEGLVGKTVGERGGGV